MFFKGGSSTMSARRLAVPVAAALALCVPTAATAGPTLLRGTVGPYRTIQLQDAQGANVLKVKAGMIAFRIEDKSSTLGFSLQGPGVKTTLTGVGFTGSKTVRLKLKKGTYTYFDATQKRAMRGTFRVV
jgi:hypothetical protein